MRRREFIAEFMAARRRFYLIRIKARDMWQSEAVMGMADARKDAEKLWRELRGSLQEFTVEQLRLLYQKAESSCEKETSKPA